MKWRFRGSNFSRSGTYIKLLTLNHMWECVLVYHMWIRVYHYIHRWGHDIKTRNRFWCRGSAHIQYLTLIATESGCEVRHFQLQCKHCFSRCTRYAETLVAFDRHRSGETVGVIQLRWSVFVPNTVSLLIKVAAISDICRLCAGGSVCIR